MNKAKVFNTISNVAEKTKLASMLVATGTYVAKVAKVPVISTGICFASIITETVADLLALSEFVKSDDCEDFDEFFEEEEYEETATENVLSEMAEELNSDTSTEEPVEKE